MTLPFACPWEPLILLPSFLYFIKVWSLASKIPKPDEQNGTESPGSNATSGSNSNSSSKKLPKQTVILCARNEADDLPATLEALSQLNRPADSFEVIVVNDRSTDATVAVVQGAIAQWQNAGRQLSLLENEPEGGKKRAISLAAKKASSDLISVLDADSQVGPEWLNAIATAFDSPRTGLVAAPALFRGDDTRFKCLVRLEYIGFLAAGLASIETSHPLYASGANLSWRKQAFQDVGGYEGLEHIPSADDTLLIQRMHMSGRWTLKALFQKVAAVETRGPQTLQSFWQQRVRWTSTEFSFEDKTALAGSIALYLIFLLTFLAPLAVGFKLLSPLAAILLFALKWIPDNYLVWRSAQLYDEDQLMRRYFPMTWLGQLLYGVLVPWFGTFSTFTWREHESS
jgi:poly-beta-1,6-N-acetyl-D-glucosamine synthase